VQQRVGLHQVIAFGRQADWAHSICDRGLGFPMRVPAWHFGIQPK
jgi:hypothetical protein